MAATALTACVVLRVSGGLRALVAADRRGEGRAGCVAGYAGQVRLQVVRDVVADGICGLVSEAQHAPRNPDCFQYVPLLGGGGTQTCV